MARIKRFFKDSSNIGHKHPTVVDCGYAIVVADGERYLQLNTYGSDARRLPGKTSQTIQLDRGRALELARLLHGAFEDPR
jgi:hypothetical protein